MCSPTYFSPSEGINAHSNISFGESQGTRNYASSSSSHAGGLSVGENDSRRTEERKHEAIATVRLVSKDGDVIWSATAESLGGKFLGASADVADKIAKRLVTRLQGSQAAGCHSDGCYHHGGRDQVNAAVKFPGPAADGRAGVHGDANHNRVRRGER